MRAFLILLAALGQFGQRPPLTPAETLLEAALLRAIDEQPTGPTPVGVIEGSVPAAGDILLTCQPGECSIATQAAQKLQALVAAAQLRQPVRTIRIVSAIDPAIAGRAKAAIHVAQTEPRGLQIVRGLWSTAGVADEVVEIFSRQGSHLIEVRPLRRMRSFETYLPAPVDATLHGRILDLEKGITSVWTSMGITSAPFVPAAQRIRGRGGEDRRVVVKVGAGPLPTPEPPTALLKFHNSAVVIYELGNFIDGERSISDIRDAVSAEFGSIALPVVVDYFERLAMTGAVAIR